MSKECIHFFGPLCRRERIYWEGTAVTLKSQQQFNNTTWFSKRDA